jgi:proline iminopeptidase
VADSREAVRHVAVQGAILEVTSVGDGPAVLLPSGAGIAYYRNTLSERLQSQLNFIYVAVRGTGGSTGSVEGATFGALADDLDAVRGALWLERVFVLGHSNHGCIALEYGLRHPAHCAGVLSVGSAPDFRDAIALGQARWEREGSAEAKVAIATGQASVAERAPTLSPAAVAFENYLAMAPLSWRHPERIDHRAIWGGAPRGMGDYFQWMGAALAGFNATPRLSSLQAPLLALSGRWDYLCPVELWERSIGLAPRGRLVVFEEAAHNPQMECADAFDSEVLRLVNRAG